MQGGLGNQLFQYAAARALVDRSGSKLLLDLRLLRQDRKRKFALDGYSVAGEVVDSSQLPRPAPLSRWAARAGFRIGSLRQYPVDAPVYRERDSAGCWDPDVGSVRAPVVLHGYFQSERYFSSIADLLRAELTPSRTPSEAFRQIELTILAQGPTSASVHVRRGDYASDPQALAFHGVLGAEYYRRALELLHEHVPDLHLFMFTDDPLAAAALLPAGAPVTMVSGRGLSDVDELALMRACCHHVIANSSYSWWGAWLGSTGGLTIAPRRWFAQFSEAAIRDRFPSHWHVVG